LPQEEDHFKNQKWYS